MHPARSLAPPKKAWVIAIAALAAVAVWLIVPAVASAMPLDGLPLCQEASSSDALPDPRELAEAQLSADDRPAYLFSPRDDDAAPMTDSRGASAIAPKRVHAVSDSRIDSARHVNVFASATSCVVAAWSLDAFFSHDAPPKAPPQDVLEPAVPVVSAAAAPQPPAILLPETPYELRDDDGVRPDLERPPNARSV